MRCYKRKWHHSSFYFPLKLSQRHNLCEMEKNFSIETNFPLKYEVGAKRENFLVTYGSSFNWKHRVKMKGSTKIKVPYRQQFDYAISSLTDF